jgi:hypothetical protein
MQVRGNRTNNQHHANKTMTTLFDVLPNTSHPHAHTHTTTRARSSRPVTPQMSVLNALIKVLLLGVSYTLIRCMSWLCTRPLAPIHVDFAGLTCGSCVKQAISMQHTNTALQSQAPTSPRHLPDIIAVVRHPVHSLPRIHKHATHTRIQDCAETLCGLKPVRDLVNSEFKR